MRKNILNFRSPEASVALTPEGGIEDNVYFKELQELRNQNRPQFPLRGLGASFLCKPQSESTVGQS